MFKIYIDNVEVKCDNQFDIEEEFMSEQDFNYMINEYEDFLDSIELIYATYEYIKDFKENQINIFEDWYNDFYKEEYGDILNGEIEK